MRPRHFGWPSSRDLERIIYFGCHFFQVGHPLSPLKGFQWRISFSMAERTLVLYFNHIQIQCYAIMKIILKEFIKPRCSPQSNVLCSYFIKTFLFWKFESVDINVWFSENFRGCMKYLIVEFSKCIQNGVLAHYFFPEINLLSIKLTDETQKKEPLKILETAIEYDMRNNKGSMVPINRFWTQFE